MITGDVYDAILKKALGFYYKESVSEYEKELKNICYCKNRKRFYVNENFVCERVTSDFTLAKKKKFCKKNVLSGVCFNIK